MTVLRHKPLVIFIVGPTATGKSEFSVVAAERFGGEIINTDSVQVYQHVDIGTAKPTASQLARVSHHLFSFVAANETCTAGEFRRRALEKIEQRSATGVTTFFAVGGSGFYVQALEKGMFPAPDIPAAVRETVERDRLEKGLSALYAELVSRDPEYAREISANDSYRIKRALEINRYLQEQSLGGEHADGPSGTTWSEIRRRFVTESAATRPFDVCKIGIIRPRPLIRKAVEKRTREMLRNGLLDEVRDLRARGLQDWAPLASVGYKQVQDYLDGLLPEAELEAAIVTSTMQLVKRQTTWFRRDPEIRWFDAEAGWDNPLRFVAELLASRPRVP